MRGAWLGDAEDMRKVAWFNTETRTGRYLRTLGSSLILFGSATLYSIGVVPMVLLFEDASTLGLWILISQIGIWLGALDLGLSASSIRFFVNPVARHDIRGLQGRFQATLWLAAAQGAIIAFLGFSGAFLAQLFSIPEQQLNLFCQLYFTQCMVSGFSFLSRPFASILLAAQRFEFNYLGNAASFLVSLALAWVGLQQGWGLWSLMAGSVLQYALTVVLSVYGVYRLGFLPGLFGAPASLGGLVQRIVHESLSFAIGPLATMAGGILQSAFLSRIFGLETVAVWNVGVKAATVLTQILSKFFESSFSGLSELWETGRRDRMFDRFGQLLGWSLVLSGSLALILLFANDPFIRIWTNGEIHWPIYGTFAVSLMLVVGTLHRALLELTKVLVLWNPIRLSPLFDLGTMILCLLAAYAATGFPAFLFAAAVGPFLGGLLMNMHALRRASGRSIAELVPSKARLIFLLLVAGCLLAAGWIYFR